MEILDIANRILGSDHPSIGTSRAVFLFALGKGPARFLSVETNNPWAVLCMERLLLTDQKASDNCQVLQIIRDHRNTGKRNPMTEEIPFVDFMLDIVDMDRLLGGHKDDVLVLECFRRSLSDAERQRAFAKLQAIQNIPVPGVFDGYVAPKAVPVALTLVKTPIRTGVDQSDRLITALVGLGFKKTDVRKVVSGLGDKVYSDDLQVLLQSALRSLAA